MKLAAGVLFASLACGACVDAGPAPACDGAALPYGLILSVRAGIDFPDGTYRWTVHADDAFGVVEVAIAGGVASCPTPCRGIPVGLARLDVTMAGDHAVLNVFYPGGEDLDAPGPAHVNASLANGERAVLAAYAIDPMYRAEDLGVPGCGMWHRALVDSRVDVPAP